VIANVICWNGKSSNHQEKGDRMECMSLETGEIIVTPRAASALEKAEETSEAYVRRHAHGDWGGVSEQGRARNERAVKEGLQVDSAYRTSAGTILWVNTTADRRTTVVCVPQDYFESQVRKHGARFLPGKIVMTPSALRAIDAGEHSIEEFLIRHCCGDWGESDAARHQVNDRALHDGAPLLSVYRTRAGETLWVLTDATRTQTMFFLAEQSDRAVSAHNRNGA
jgi:hypothetical protein